MSLPRLLSKLAELAMPSEVPFGFCLGGVPRSQMLFHRFKVGVRHTTPIIFTAASILLRTTKKKIVDLKRNCQVITIDFFLNDSQTPLKFFVSFIFVWITAIFAGCEGSLVRERARDRVLRQRLAPPERRCRHPVQQQGKAFHRPPILAAGEGGSPHARHHRPHGKCSECCVLIEASRSKPEGGATLESQFFFRAE